jgi:nitrite reductase (NO-forming)
MKTISRSKSFLIIISAALFLVACNSQPDSYALSAAIETPPETSQEVDAAGGIAAVETPVKSSQDHDPSEGTAAVENPGESSQNGEVKFTLKTISNNGGLAFLGVGGEIDGLVNPDLIAHPGDALHITLLNGDGMPHDLYFTDFDVKLPYVSKIGDHAEVVFDVGDMQPGSYVYYCTVPGHRQAGQEGKLVVSTG